MYSSIDEISTECKNTAVMFSCGRDSIAMLDLFVARARDSVSKIVFMYYCPGLSYEEKVLRYYEKRYEISVTRIAHPDAAYYVNQRNKKRKTRVADVERMLKAEYDVEWVAWGFRKDESLQRRGQLSMAQNGIDWKYRKLFPIAEWSKKLVSKYIEKQKLILPPEYKIGFRDLNTFKGESLLYIYNTYPHDYRKIIEVYPDVEGELMRALSGIGGKSK